MLSENKIFNKLFEIAKTSKDKEGIVAACLARDGKIISISASSDNSKSHAEFLVIKKIINSGISINDTDILFSTVEPCSKRSSEKNDCCSFIIANKIKNVIFAVSDGQQTRETQKRLRDAGVKINQTKNKEIIKKSRAIFNSSMLNPSKHSL